MITKVILFIVLVVQGHPPVPYQEEMPTIDDCLAAITDILHKTPPANGSILAGCVVVAPPTKEAS